MTDAGFLDDVDQAPLPMESHADRLKRFQDGAPSEVISTLLNSINIHFNNEIAKAAETSCWSLMLIGTHAVALTISYGLFGLDGKAGYVRFLKEYMDRPEPGSDFSTVGSAIHNWRNVLAHQWLGTAGHSFGFDTRTSAGWERRAGILVVNPSRYHAAYRKAFETSSSLWRPDRILTPDELRVAKQRLIDKFVRR